MNVRALVGDDSVPRLAPHVRLQFDTARDRWTIQAPERTFMLDPIAHAIVSRCGGSATVRAIIDDLCIAYSESPREVVMGDVVTLIQDFADKGVLAL